MSDNDFVKPIHPIEEIDANFASNLSQTPRDPEFHNAPPSAAPSNESKKDYSNMHFKGQQQNEIVHCFCRKHWIVLVPHFIGVTLVLIAAISLYMLIPKTTIASIFSPLAYRAVTVFLLAALTVYLHFFFNRIFNYYLQILIVTNFRVILLDQTLFFTRNRDSIDLPEIQDIVIHQKGVLKTILNYGAIIITLSSVHATKTFHYVPNPEYYFRKINKTKREYIMTRRMEKGALPGEKQNGSLNNIVPNNSVR